MILLIKILFLVFDFSQLTIIFSELVYVKISRADDKKKTEKTSIGGANKLDSNKTDKLSTSKIDAKKGKNPSKGWKNLKKVDKLGIDGATGEENPAISKTNKPGINGVDKLGINRANRLDIGKVGKPNINGIKKPGTGKADKLSIGRIDKSGIGKADVKKNPNISKANVKKNLSTSKANKPGTSK